MVKMFVLCYNIVMAVPAELMELSQSALDNFLGGPDVVESPLGAVDPLLRLWLPKSPDEAVIDTLNRAGFEADDEAGTILRFVLERTIYDAVPDRKREQIMTRRSNAADILNKYSSRGVFNAN
jgi:hypothetical protein